MLIKVNVFRNIICLSALSGSRMNIKNDKMCLLYSEFHLVKTAFKKC